MLPWLRERGVAVLVGDAVNDVQPSGVEGMRRPIHQLTQVFIGLPLVDNGYLEDVAKEAAAAMGVHDLLADHEGSRRNC